MKVSFFNQAVFNSFYEWTIKDKKVAKKNRGINTRY